MAPFQPSAVSRMRDSPSTARLRSRTLPPISIGTRLSGRSSAPAAGRFVPLAAAYSVRIACTDSCTSGAPLPSMPVQAPGRNRIARTNPTIHGFRTTSFAGRIFTAAR